MDKLHSILRLIERVERYLLVSLLLILVGFNVLQILMRNLFESGLLWGGAFSSVLVLWIGLLGAMYAGRNNRHIRIDLISHYLPERLQHHVNRIANLSAAVICGIACWFSFLFVVEEFHYGNMAFAQVPVWLTMSIIPVVFFVLSFRFLSVCVQSFFKPL